MKEIKDKIMRNKLEKYLRSKGIGWNKSYKMADEILSLIAENELGDSGVTGKHGELHDVALSHTHSDTGKTPVERPLPSITDTENDYYPDCVCPILGEGKCDGISRICVYKK